MLGDQVDESDSMETYQTILTKLDIRRFSSKRIPGELILKILEATRSTGTAFNAQTRGSSSFRRTAD